MGLYGSYSKDDRTEREKQLEWELERAREDEDRRREHAEQEREERRREQRERWRYEERQADNWPEAFQKQAMLCWLEHRRYPDDLDYHYFEYTAQANEKALEIWRLVAASKQAELDELQRHIDAVWDTVRNEVAEKLIESSEKREFRMVAEILRDNQLAGYLDW